MKLILFLAAVYALIFYQTYKIEKAKIFTPSPKEIFDSRSPKQYPGLTQPDNYVNADHLVRGSYSVYRDRASRFRATNALYSIYYE